MDTKKYKLLRELPMTDVGTTFYRNGNSYYPCEKPDGSKFELSDGKGYGIHSNVVENNPTWFEEILPERYDVWITELKSDKHISQYSILSILRIPYGKLQLVKQAVDSVLNDEDDKISIKWNYSKVDGGKLYSQSELDKAIDSATESAFYAARLDEHESGMYFKIINEKKFPSYLEYKNHNNKDK